MGIGLAINRLNIAGGFCFMLVILAYPALAGNNSGAAFSTWPDTGQTRCYNDTVEIPCPAPGEPFYGQDAQYAGPARSYTLLGGGTMVQDNVTGLVWEIKNNMDNTANYSNPHDADNIYTWCDPNTATNGDDQGTCGDHDTKDFIDQLNSDGGFGGYTNWRLPTIKELATLVDLGRNSPAIDPIFAATTQPSYYYWSSTTYAGDPGVACRIGFRYGYGYYFANKRSANYVRAVRGGQNPPENRFIDNNDGTVTDTVTCLQWQKTTMDTKNGVGFDAYTWQDALAVSEGLSLAGHSDWRLPDRNELRSLVDYSRYEPAIDPVFAATTEASYYRSSTTSAGDPDHAWPVNFYESGLDYYVGKSSAYYVRAVRGGQCGNIGTWTPSPSMGRIYNFPMEGPPGTTFTQSGSGFTPNSTVTLHFRNHVGEELIPIQQSTNSSGNFSLTYTAPLDKPIGTHSWWAVDDVTGGISDIIGYQITGAPGTVTNIATGTKIALPPIEGVTYGILTSEGTFDASKETFIIVHGWNTEDTTDRPQWMKNMGTAIKNGLKSPAKGSNVLYWNWQEKAKGLIPPYWQTGASGVNLASALMKALPANYSQDIHFIGHSLGTFVSGYATKYARQKLAFGQNINHLVFLDSPNYSMVDVSWFLVKNSSSIFLENYISEVGVDYLKVADINVYLTKAMTYQDGFGIVYAHSYPYYWYTSSVNNFSDNVLDNTSPSSTVPWGFYWWSAQNRENAESRYTQQIAEPHYRLSEGSLWDVGIERTVGKVVDLTGALVDVSAERREQLEDGAARIGKVVVVVGTKTYMVANDIADAVVDVTGHAVLNTTYGFLNLIHSSTAVLDLPVAIPANANALSFGIEFLYSDPGTMLEVFINGNPVYHTTSELSMSEGLKMIPWINLEAHAGQTVTLSLRLSNPNADTEGKIKIDDLVLAKIEDPEVPDGDVNNDGSVNLTDTVLALQVVSGQETSNKLYRNADVNTDEKIGTAEVIYTLQKVAGQR